VVSPKPSASQVVPEERAAPASDSSAVTPSIVSSASALSDVDPAPSTNAPAVVPSAAASAATQEDPAEALYREAHALHFRGGSPALAVAAWDRYIAAAPRGRFVAEAQYNRALALLRAGRKSEGLSALRPFATGSYGSYRRDEAKQILDAAERAGEK
jgi:TolA-binding protein